MSTQGQPQTPPPTTGLAPNSHCPRCGGDFRCGAVGGDAHCDCFGTRLTDALRQQLARDYPQGCLCMGCLRELIRLSASSA